MIEFADTWSTFECDVLAYDPFAGDFGGTDDKLFVDKMVNAAKCHEDACHICGGSVEPGERHRYNVQKFDGKMMTFRWCWSCCTAMARNWEDGGVEICARQDLHRGT